jgi:ribosome-associated protein
VRDVEVRAGGIDLGQLLKFAGLVDTGGDAKALLADGVVEVNGEVDTRRGRSLVDGDVVAVPDAEPVRVVETR